MAAKVTVFGAGSWGTALAILIARNGFETTLWGHDPAHMATLRRERRNGRFLPDADFPDALSVSDDIRAAAAVADIRLVAVPSHAFREALSALQSPPGRRLAWATKGLDGRGDRLLHEIAREILGAETPLAVLSGPTFAGEVAAGQPTAITVASAHPEFAREMVGLLHNSRFRAYTSDDMIGVQLGGAVKNVLAIAAGVADGLGFGANARAALVTRGLAEMTRLVLAMGGKPETLTGLAGVGDLILTCTDDQSRNRRFGLGLGQGLPREEIAARIGQEIEGAFAVSAVRRLARAHGVEMPIAEQVYRILEEGLPPAEAVRNLLLREPKPESLAPAARGGGAQG
jgi:glycerol-3-phosphate dehydrogenase (NAD(P)+)